MKRVLPFLLLFVFVVVPVVLGVVTGPGATRFRAEMARRGWRAAECIEPGVESV